MIAALLTWRAIHAAARDCAARLAEGKRFESPDPRRRTAVRPAPRPSGGAGELRAASATATAATTARASVIAPAAGRSAARRTQADAVPAAPTGHWPAEDRPDAAAATPKFHRGEQYPTPRGLRPLARRLAPGPARPDAVGVPVRRQIGVRNPLASHWAELAGDCQSSFRPPPWPGPMYGSKPNKISLVGPYRQLVGNDCFGAIGNEPAIISILPEFDHFAPFHP